MAGTASQLRICYVSAEYPTTDAPDVGRQLFELCRRLEIPSLLVVGRRGEPLPPPPHATLHAVPFTDALLGAHRGVRLAGAAAFKAAAFSLFFARSAKRVAGFRPAVVHVETPMPMLHALFARHALGAKVSLSLVGSDVRRVERSRLLQALVRQADVVVPVSPHMRDIATRWLPEARVRVIPNAVDGGLFRPLDVERRPQFLTPAAFIWEKGHDVLLPAFGQVVRLSRGAAPAGWRRVSGAGGPGPV